MFNIRFGINFESWEHGGVFGSPNTFNTVDEASREVYKILETSILSVFPSAIYDELIMVCENCVATYEDGTQLIGRIDGTIDDDGEFYIEIVKDKDKEKKN